MNKLQIFTGRILVYALRISHFTVILLKRIFGKKTILLVSKQQIKSYSISPITQIIFLFVLLWLGSSFGQLLRYNSVIKEKSVEISDLKKVNQQFEDKVESLNTNLQKINLYFKSISGYNSEPTKNSDQTNIDQKVKDLFGNTKLNSDDQQIAAKIADSNLILDDIKGAAIKRINDLEQKLAIAGISLVNNKAILKNNSDNNDNRKVVSLNSKGDLSKRQGGPFREFRKNVNSSFSGSIFDLGKDPSGIKNEIEYLANLDKFIHFAPLAAPMKNYYVSSIFGKRSDPIKGIPAKHNGMDFVGKNGARILSPSAGKVIFAGKFGSYGNTVVIDHGYGFTTRYGHLSRLNVRAGDSVQKEQIIAAQGSTGRSTGQHLHYEVRYHNIPLNPKKFLQAGQEIFNANNG
ncbi:MAG: M23 family metallopeptidase [Pseudomonadota bacterium]